MHTLRLLLAKKLKRVIYPAMDLMDIAAPGLVGGLTRYYCRYKDINDLHYYREESPYSTLGPFVTLYAKRPSHYKGFLQIYHMDNEGLPQIEVQGKTVRNYVTLIQFGLSEYGYFLDTGEEVHRRNCLKAADKLVQTQDSRGGWPCEWDHHCLNVNATLKSGWYCALAQGEAVSLLARAHSLTQNPAYPETAHRALALLTVPVEEGGVLARLGGYDFFEEYPTTPSSYTLNGFMFCMVGLYDGAQYFHDELAAKLLDSALRTLETVLPLYDNGRLSVYDLRHLTNPAGYPKDMDQKYHVIHVKLLTALNQIHPSPVFAYYIDKWKHKRRT